MRTLIFLSALVLLSGTAMATGKSHSKTITVTTVNTMTNGGDHADITGNCTVPNVNYNLAMNHLTCRVQGSGAQATTREVTFTREISVPCKRGKNS